MKSKQAATVIQESATLKVGKNPLLDGAILSYPGNLTLIKSTTYPFDKRVMKDLF